MEVEKIISISIFLIGRKKLKNFKKSIDFIEKD